MLRVGAGRYWRQGAVPDFVGPKLLAEIKYRAKSAEGKVRHRYSRDCAGTFERECPPSAAGRKPAIEL